MKPGADAYWLRQDEARERALTARCSKNTQCEDKTVKVATMIRPVKINNTEFEVSAQEQSDGGWHWLITAPGRLVLSGEAPNENSGAALCLQSGRSPLSSFRPCRRPPGGRYRRGSRVWAKLLRAGAE